MKTLVAVILMSILGTASLHAQAAETSTLRVVVVQTNDLPGYVKALGEVKRLFGKVEPKMVVRAWQATYAGPETGAVIVSVEYPGSFSKFAQAWERGMADKDIATQMAALGGVRKVIGDSLYNELAL